MDDKEVYFSTGRGGAGNIKSSETLPSPKLVPQGSNTPQLQTQYVTTGRGGYGNMMKNDNPEMTRKAQDVDGQELSQVASNKSFTIGRGGAGNVVSNENHDDLYAVTSTGPGEPNKDKKGFMGKIKGFFKN